MRIPARTNIEGLPFELLVRIANFSRPNSFEPLMLSSKTIYEAGLVLIDDHNFCKRWNKCDKYDCRNDPEGHIHTNMPTYVFKRILEAPKSIRPWLLDYKSKVFLSRNSWARDDPELMSRVRGQMPWIRDEYSHLMARFPSLFGGFEPRDDLVEFLEGRKDSISEGDIGPLCAFLLLFLCSNSKSLVIEEYENTPGSNCISVLSQLDRHEMGHEILPHLSSINVCGPHQFLANMDFEVAQPVLSLQRNQILELGQLAMVSAPQEPTELASSPTLKADLKKYPSMLRQLILREAIILPEHLTRLLYPLRHLESLLLDVDVYAPYKLDPNLQDFWPPKYRGSETVNAIVQSRGTELKHLSLTMRKVMLRPLMDPLQRIASFHGFAILTHLECDIRILDCSKELVLGSYVPEWIPISIWKTLPLSIQVVRIIIPSVSSSKIYGLLRETPAKKDQFPLLRKVVLRVSRRAGPSYLTQTLEPVQFLLHAVTNLGIEVIVEEVENKIEPVKSWDD